MRTQDHKIMCPEVIGPSAHLPLGETAHPDAALVSGAVITRGYEFLPKFELEDLRMHCAENSRLCASSQMFPK